MNTVGTVDTTVEDLVTAAGAGDESAWAEIVRRYQRIITSVCRRYRLGAEESADLSQDVWLQVTSHLEGIREPRALPGWIKTTASRLALATLQSRRRLVPSESTTQDPGGSGPVVVDELTDAEAFVLSDERRAAVRDGLAELSDAHRALLTMLVADPPVSYQQISAELHLPLGSIGPTRARALHKLAATDAIRGIIDAYAGAA